MKKILIIGNLGYIGPALVDYFRSTDDNLELIGFDTGFFEGCLINHLSKLRYQVHKQFYGDVRYFDETCLEGVSAVVYLAAISNDPMGNKFKSQTLDINFHAGIKIANLAKKRGIKSFVFASSCSIYGSGGILAKKEDDEINPLTPYAQSKISSEDSLKLLADEDFHVTCLRFATACGASPRMRLDLVLNDFVASAITTGQITVLSDGSPWRPLIDVEDM